MIITREPSYLRSCGWDFADAWLEIGWEYRRRLFNASLRGGKFVRWE